MTHWRSSSRDDVAARLKRDADLRERATIAFIVLLGTVFGLLVVGPCWLATQLLSLAGGF